MSSLIKVILISLVAGAAIELPSNLAGSVAKLNLGSGSFGSNFVVPQVVGQTRRVSEIASYQYSFSFGQKKFNADYKSFKGFSSLSRKDLDVFSEILKTEFQRKVVNFSRIQQFCVSKKIKVSSIQESLFALFRKVHLLDNQIKFDYREYYLSELKKRNVIEIVKRYRSSLTNYEVVVKGIESILADYFQLIIETGSNITISEYIKIKQFKIQNFQAVEFESVFSSLYTETSYTYTRFQKAQVIYVPVLQDRELLEVGYSHQEATKIVTKNRFYQEFKQSYSQVDFSSEVSIRSYYQQTAIKYKDCSECIAKIKTNVDKAIEQKKQGAPVEAIKSSFKTTVKQEFTSEVSSRISSVDAIEVAEKPKEQRILLEQPKEDKTKKPNTEEDKTKKPTTEEDKTKKPTTKEDKTKKPATGEDKTKKPATEEDKTKKPTTEEDKTKKPATEEDKTKKPTTEEDKTKKPTTEEDKTKKPANEEDKTKKPATGEDKTKKPTTEEVQPKEKQPKEVKREETTPIKPEQPAANGEPSKVNSKVVDDAQNTIPAVQSPVDVTKPIVQIPGPKPANPKQDKPKNNEAQKLLVESIKNKAEPVEPKENKNQIPPAVQPLEKKVEQPIPKAKPQPEIIAPQPLEGKKEEAQPLAQAPNETAEEKKKREEKEASEKKSKDTAKTAPKA